MLWRRVEYRTICSIGFYGINNRNRMFIIPLFISWYKMFQIINLIILDHNFFQIYKEKSLVETFFLVLVMVLCVMCIVIGIIFWINSSSNFKINILLRINCFQRRVADCNPYLTNRAPVSTEN